MRRKRRAKDAPVVPDPREWTTLEGFTTVWRPETWVARRTKTGLGLVWVSYTILDVLPPRSLVAQASFVKDDRDMPTFLELKYAHPGNGGYSRSVSSLSLKVDEGGRDLAYVEERLRALVRAYVAKLTVHRYPPKSRKEASRWVTTTLCT